MGGDHPIHPFYKAIFWRHIKWSGIGVFCVGTLWYATGGSAITRQNERMRKLRNEYERKIASQPPIRDVEAFTRLIQNYTPRTDFIEDQELGEEIELDVDMDV